MEYLSCLRVQSTRIIHYSHPQNRISQIRRLIINDLLLPLGRVLPISVILIKTFFEHYVLTGLAKLPLRDKTYFDLIFVEILT